jgi:hypothetical protein
MEATSTAIEKEPSVPKALLTGVLLIAFDAFILNQGGIAALVIAWALIVRLPLIMFRDKYKTTRRKHLVCQGIYVSAALLVFVANHLNNRLAQQRGEVVVSAIYAFHSAHQRYPNTLEELVPEQLPKVPLAKYAFGFNTFWYAPNESNPMFFYVNFPPFGRTAYSFRRKGWFDFD